MTKMTSLYNNDKLRRIITLSDDTDIFSGYEIAVNDIKEAVKIIKTINFRGSIKNDDTPLYKVLVINDAGRKHDDEIIKAAKKIKYQVFADFSDWCDFRKRTSFFILNGHIPDDVLMKLGYCSLN